MSTVLFGKTFFDSNPSFESSRLTAVKVLPSFENSWLSAVKELASHIVSTLVSMLEI